MRVALAFFVQFCSTLILKIWMFVSVMMDPLNGLESDQSVVRVAEE